MQPQRTFPDSHAVLNRPITAKMPLARTSADAPAAGSARAQPEVLAVWHNVAPGRAAAVREWYAREHHLERLALPGFLETRRYDRVTGAGADILGLYHVSSPDVLGCGTVREKLAEASTWTRSIVPFLRDSSVTRCGISAEAGLGEGGHVAALASSSGNLPRPQTLCGPLLSLPGVLRVRALAGRKTSTGIKAAETRFGEQLGAPISWALLVDAESPEAAQTALYSARDLGGVSEPAQCAVYRLAFCARKNN